MARHAIGHLLALSVFLCASHDIRSCTACDKHKHLHGQTNTSDDCPDETKDRTASDKEVIMKTAENSSLRGFFADEGRLTVMLKSADIQKQVSDVVQRAVKHLEAQDLLPLLEDVEHLARNMLEETGKRLSEAEDKEEKGSLTAFLIKLVRLISAVKAVRADIISVGMAWLQLRESIHDLAEAEKATVKPSEKAAVALTRFLEAELWMTTTTDSVQYSSKQLKEVLTDEKVSKAISAEEKGAQILEKISTMLHHF